MDALARCARRIGSDDRGDMLFMVSVMGSIMFLLVTSLIAVAVWQQNMASNRTRTTQATDIADAGINAYLYQLRQNNLYYQGHTDTGWVSMGSDGSYRVTVIPPTPSNPLTLLISGDSYVPLPTGRAAYPRSRTRPRSHEQQPSHER